MTVEEIDSSERRHLEAFKKWLNASESFKSLSPASKEELTVYVASLLREIGDLKGDLLREREGQVDANFESDNLR